MHAYVADGSFGGLLVFPFQCPAQTAVDMSYSPVEAKTSPVLGQNCPNPYPTGTASTEIRFELVQRTRARLQVFDAMGRQVRLLVDDVLEAGDHAAFWDGQNDRSEVVGSGIYFYRLKAGQFSVTRQLVRLR
jgi:hypothetical protein